MPFTTESARLAGQRSSRAKIKNKAAGEALEALEDVFAALAGKAKTDLEKVKPEVRLKLFLQIAEFLTPKAREAVIDIGSLSDDQVESLLQRIAQAAREAA